MNHHPLETFVKTQAYIWAQYRTDPNKSLLSFAERQNLADTLRIPLGNWKGIPLDLRAEITVKYNLAYLNYPKPDSIPNCFVCNKNPGELLLHDTMKDTHTSLCIKCWKMYEKGWHDATRAIIQRIGINDISISDSQNLLPYIYIKRLSP